MAIKKTPSTQRMMETVLNGGPPKVNKLKSFLGDLIVISLLVGSTFAAGLLWEEAPYLTVFPILWILAFLTTTSRSG